MEYAASFGIETAMVPGISSSLAVAAHQNIPITKRGSAESFWIITGTTKDHKISKDIILLNLRAFILYHINSKMFVY